MYPKLKALPHSRRERSIFLGYHNSPSCQPGEFVREENLSSRGYPALTVRRKRGVYAENVRATGMIAKDALCYTAGSRVYVNGYPIEMGLTDSPKQLVSMGAYLLIFPDKKYLNTEDFTDRGSMEVRNETSSLTFTPCTLEGLSQTPRFRGTNPPENMVNGDLWLDEGSYPNTLRVYSGATGAWEEVVTTYVKVSATGIGSGIGLYDGIFLTGSEVPQPVQEIFGSGVVWGRGEDYVILPGLLSETVTLRGSFTLSRELPPMDFVTECGNRLWGCRYGLNREGKIVNEIYASKQGDFKNFFCFMGTAADSYILSLGSDGAFTGAISYLGKPLFFKERVLHRIYGSLPESFSLQSTPCRGVAKGSDRSLTILGEKLYYLSPTGVCVYDGSLPQGISGALGEESYHGGVGGALGSTYYISILDREENPHLFAYDTAKGIWHREDGLRPQHLTTCREELYGAVDDRILALGGTGEKETGEIPFFLETGALGLHTPDRKYVTTLSLRLQMEPGSSLRLFGCYDETDVWEPLGEITGSRKRIVTLPIRPKRCDTVRIRAEGEGQVRLLSAAVTETKGSDWDG